MPVYNPLRQKVVTADRRHRGKGWVLHLACGHDKVLTSWGRGTGEYPPDSATCPECKKAAINRDPDEQ